MTAGVAGTGLAAPALVPPLRPGQCQLWWASARDAHPRLRELLDEGGRARADRLRKPAARALHLTAHALARVVTAAQLQLQTSMLRMQAVCKQCGGPHGKPQPPEPLRLSWSHSGERVVVALTLRIDIGVDVERVAPYEQETADRVLAAPERAALATLPEAGRPEGFVRYWTRKEALLKSTGDGLAVSPGLLHVTAPAAAPRLLSWSGPARPSLPLHLYDLDAGPGHLAALATVGAPVRLTRHDGSSLLAAQHASADASGLLTDPIRPTAERSFAS
ncbi:4'-phosphopantetheinyl transferase family protein [Streptomyces sp. NPDC059166]|uniref:4'-phosphopantetheinyl transferase family protein n=1 Tax=Streptomyces sp. NPDC059166 TaxID=3346752 RepID=UPI0036A987E2